MIRAFAVAAVAFLAANLFGAFALASTGRRR